MSSYTVVLCLGNNAQKNLISRAFEFAVYVVNAASAHDIKSESLHIWFSAQFISSDFAQNID